MRTDITITATSTSFSLSFMNMKHDIHGKSCGDGMANVHCKLYGMCETIMFTLARKIEAKYSA